MTLISHKNITCPHCGHHYRLTLDTSEGDQDYYEDCVACCHPIHLTLSVDHIHERVALQLDADDEQIF
ncbi:MULTISPECIES: CPXCG motif-containing cysteine-rich protein [unclassified Vibrio]|uniref:CPXCG motif-containing cysteine-rich protein n=1 Tax=Vibrio sp. HB236076 TaxID=3232307 RepID=A0AB39H7K0_9VIBR|nr:CPXCG motif-containing cysteine-rich protein [Vibrio sp. HB161653]MDP5253424.1 CPXCG motif-containing cysteine-rich protein [Vibrio sp. HB161653]